MEHPRDNEFEISVFGPRYGEAIALHLGKRRWIVVDSCLEAKGKPAAIAYLESIGVDLSHDVIALVVTHWHDDHIRGFATAADMCSSAKVFCSSALSFPEFLEIIAVYDRTPIQLQSRATSGTAEFGKLLAVMEKSGRFVDHVSANKVLLRGMEPDFPFEVWSLSPSARDADIARRSLSDVFRKQLDAMLDSRRSTPLARVVAGRPNDSAVALWVNVGDRTVLLGSDLEEHGDVARGWSAVVADNRRPLGRAEIAKVPHHGSAGAHLDAFWTELMIDRSTAILSPFVRGRVTLPTAGDTERIRGRTNAAYLTASPTHKAPRVSNQAERRTIVQNTLSCREMLPEFGHVRLRTPIQGAVQHTVALSGGAYQL